MSSNNASIYRANYDIDFNGFVCKRGELLVSYSRNGKDTLLRTRDNKEYDMLNTTLVIKTGTSGELRKMALLDVVTLQGTRILRHLDDLGMLVKDIDTIQTTFPTTRPNKEYYTFKSHSLTLHLTKTGVSVLLDYAKRTYFDGIAEQARHLKDVSISPYTFSVLRVAELGGMDLNQLKYSSRDMDRELWQALSYVLVSTFVIEYGEHNVNLGTDDIYMSYQDCEHLVTNLDLLVTRITGRP